LSSLTDDITFYASPEVSTIYLESAMPRIREDYLYNVRFTTVLIREYVSLLVTDSLVL